jgi:hypothetical protein
MQNLKMNGHSNINVLHDLTTEIVWRDVYICTSKQKATAINNITYNIILSSTRRSPKWFPSKHFVCIVFLVFAMHESRPSWFNHLLTALREK